MAQRSLLNIRSLRRLTSVMCWMKECRRVMMQELLIKVDERTPIQIRVTSAGTQSHASGLLHQNCIHDLTDFLAKIAHFMHSSTSCSASDQAGNLISMQCTSLTTNNNALNVIPASRIRYH